VRDFLISAAFLAVLMIWYGFVPGARVFALPLFVALALAVALGTGIWLAALTVKYRDFRYIVPFIVQLGLYISPVGFTSAVVPERWRLVYSLNPMVGVIDGFRWAILGGTYRLQWESVLLSTLMASLLVVTGTGYFRRTEKTFADVI